MYIHASRSRIFYLSCVAPPVCTYAGSQCNQGREFPLPHTSSPGGTECELVSNSCRSQFIRVSPAVVQKLKAYPCHSSGQQSLWQPHRHILFIYSTGFHRLASHPLLRVVCQCSGEWHHCLVICFHIQLVCRLWWAEVRNHFSLSGSWAAVDQTGGSVSGRLNSRRLGSTQFHLIPRSYHGAVSCLSSVCQDAGTWEAAWVFAIHHHHCCCS